MDAFLAQKIKKYEKRLIKHYINIASAFAGVLVLMLFFRSNSEFWTYFTVILSVFVIIVCSGVVFMKINYFLPALSNVQKPSVLLTFDDGPNEKLTPKVLAILKEQNIAAVFFVVGEKAMIHPNLIQQIKNEGHLIGNHTQNHHPLFSMQSSTKVEMEIRKCDATIQKIIGEIPNLFRPPVGYTNPRIARILKKLGKKTIGWQVRSYDSVFKDPETLKKRLLRKTKAGNIVLLHDNLPQTASMLESFILEAKQNGIIFVNHSTIKILILKHS